MEHKFNIGIAQLLGIEEAIMLHYFYFWTAKNAANEKHQYDGLCWTYNSKKAFVTLFPYMNETKIFRILKNLEDRGYVAKGNFSEDKWDRTNWYALTVGGLYLLKSHGYDISLFHIDALDNVKMNDGTCQNDVTIHLEDAYNNKQIIKKVNKESDDLFEECWIAYRRKGKKGKSKSYWDKLTEKEKSLVLQHIRAYVSAKELQYQQDFERYLRDKTFTSIVFKGNMVIYDPTRNNGSEENYNPTCGGSLIWNEQMKCYLYIGWYTDGDDILDGYTKESRPDGATIMLNNARGTLVWSRETKEWRKE